MPLRGNFEAETVTKLGHRSASYVTPTGRVSLMPFCTSSCQKKHDCSEHITFKCYVSPEEKTISSPNILGSTARDVAARAPVAAHYAVPRCVLLRRVLFTQQLRVSLCGFPCEDSGSCDWLKHSHVTRSASRLGSVGYYGLVEMNEFYMEPHTETLMGAIY